MTSSRKAVFLDRDGTINVDKGYVYRREDFEYLPGVKQALRLLQEAGYLLVIITNQSGIACGFYSEEDFEELTDWMIEDLADSGIGISAVYHCPHHPDVTGECSCRKPALGLYAQAAHDFGLTMGSCWAVGDRLRDVAVAEKTDCEGILLAKGACEPSWKLHIAASLLDAAHIIIEGTR